MWLMEYLYIHISLVKICQTLQILGYLLYHLVRDFFPSTIGTSKTVRSTAEEALLLQDAQVPKLVAAGMVLGGNYRLPKTTILMDPLGGTRFRILKM